MVAQADSECVVVDFDCPDGTSAWVSAHHPGVRRVEISAAPHFNASRARNLGARMASGEWLAFIDADIVLEREFANEVLRLARRGHFLRPSPLTRETSGSFVCHRDDFAAASGYDEVLEGYGGEDIDLYFRLERQGTVQGSFPASLLQSLLHDDQLRSRHHEIADLELNRLINSTYNHIKYDLMRETEGQLPTEDVRRAVYSEVRKALLDPRRGSAGPARIVVTLPVRHLVRVPIGWTIRRQWTFFVEPQTGQSPGR